jgi:hypothetical protein
MRIIFSTRLKNDLGVLNAAEKVVKDFQEAEKKRKVVPWTPKKCVLLIFLILESDRSTQARVEIYSTGPSR